MERFRLIVFDLDGTLIDSERDLAESVNELLAGYGSGPLAHERIAAMVGSGARVLVRRACAAAGIEPDPAEAMARFMGIYDRRLLDHTRPYPGVPEVLRDLAPRRLAVLTNKPGRPTERVLEELDLRQHFSDVVCSDGHLPRKPAPDGLAWLMRQADVQPGQTLLVGDSSIDLETARAGGTAFCLAAYGFGARGQVIGKLQEGDLRVATFGELLTVLGSPSGEPTRPPREARPQRAATNL